MTSDPPTPPPSAEAFANPPPTATSAPAGVTRPGDGDRAKSSPRKNGRSRKAGAAKAKLPPAKAHVPELVALRREWRTSLDQHRLTIEARFNELEAQLATSKGRRKQKPVVKAITHLRLKPRKGRLRDLKAVDKLLDDTLEKLES